MSACSNPSSPSYDPAAQLNATDRKVIWLCEHAWNRMNEWARNFCQSVYGASPLSRRQHIRLSILYKKHSSNTEAGNAEQSHG